MIQFISVKKRFADNTIAYDDYVFENGKNYLILGASGSGKSTLLNMIAGVVLPSEGEIHIDGTCVTKGTQAARDKIRTRQIGYIYQDFKLIEDMSVEDNIRVLEMCGIKSHDFKNITAELGIGDKTKRRVKNLSGGEKQRVAIARALVKNPDIILADEPTGSLNYEIGDAIVKRLLNCTKGKLLIMVSHDVRFVGYFDVVIDLTNGGALNA